ncbi:MAG: glutathione S-transferase family protein [Hyphomicrobiales bacterium]|nr:glutathione S-transferase family protein [Hyphomicrobiales bacterium]
MTRMMFDLCADGDIRFSPYCWRARMALAHKGLEASFLPVGFSAIAEATEGFSKTVPVLVDGEAKVADSWEIASYLETAYPDRPSLFDGDSGRNLTKFVEQWANIALHPPILKAIIVDVHDRLLPEDKAYFRESREKRLRAPLEEVQAAREDHRKALKVALLPLRQLLHQQPFFGGDAPRFVDYIVFGSLQWPRLMSDFPLIPDDDPVADWFSRCLDLFDGLGRNAG